MSFALESKLAYLCAMLMLGCKHVVQGMTRRYIQFAMQILRSQKNINLAWRTLVDLLCKHLPHGAVYHLVSGQQLLECDV